MVKLELGVFNITNKETGITEIHASACGDILDLKKVRGGKREVVIYEDNFRLSAEKRSICDCLRKWRQGAGHP